MKLRARGVQLYPRCTFGDLCAPCTAAFQRWAGERWNDPVARSVAFALWLREYPTYLKESTS